MGEDQAEDVEEATPVVDALLGSIEKQALQRPGREGSSKPGISPQQRKKHATLEKPLPVTKPAFQVRTRQTNAFHAPGGSEPVHLQRQVPAETAGRTDREHDARRAPGTPAVLQPSVDPVSARLDALERQLRDGLVSTIENVVSDHLAGPARQKLVAEITASLESGAVQSVIKRFKLFFTAQVKDVVKAELKNEVMAELARELRAEFQHEIIEARQVTSRLAGSHENLRKLVGEDIKASVTDGLREEFASALGQARHAGNAFKEGLDPLRKELKSTLKAELRHDIEQKIRADLPALFRHEIKDELVREIRDELDNRLKRDLAIDIGESVESDVKEHVRRYMKRQARLAVMNAGPEHPVHLVIIDFNNLWAIANKVTTRLPNIKRLLALMRDALHEYDDHFEPCRVSGHVYASKYHEVNVNRILSTQFSDDPELEQILKQFQLEVQSEKKMLANGQDQKYRDVDVMMATRATALFSNTGNKVASVTIVSGDGDFGPVIDAAKQLGIYTIVFSFKENLATLLKTNADTFQYLNKPSKFDASRQGRPDPIAAPPAGV